MQIGKEEVNLALLLNAVILYTESTKNFTKRLLNMLYS